MTKPNLPPQVDPRRPSVPTSSLPLVGSPYGQQHHRLPNLSQHPLLPPPSYHSNNPPPSYHSRNDSPYQSSSSLVSASNNNYNNSAPAGLVTTSVNHNRPSVTPPSPPSLLKNNVVNYYNDPHQHHSALLPQHNTTNETAAETSPSSPNSSHRPLNVIDALAYLDQVKGRFSDKPNVYNQFLDIMKDFKSQSIDTPGVIERVSTLFKGYPLLISGFNTFLPAGYRIECSIDPRDPNRIIVTTPNGNTTTSTTTTAEELSKINGMPSHYYQQPQYTPPPLQQQSYPSSASTLPPPPSYNGGIYNNNTPMVAPAPPPPMIPPPPARAPSASPHPSDRRPPVEFNHAINYVNRIKNRFANNADIYKQFLEILQTYQKEQKPIKEVYAHVQYLFDGEDDLLAEFKQFLPEIGQLASPPYGLKRSLNSLPPAHVSSSTPSKRKKTTTAMTTKKSKLFPTKYEDQDDDTLSFSTFDPQRPNVSGEEVELFEKIRKYIGSKPSYDEFLKTLNLYTLQIVEMDQLIGLVKVFLGSNKELFDTFKQAVGYDPKEHAIEKPASSAAKPDLTQCKVIKSSPSYRAVPREWQVQPCSGRDQMCWEVLNDEYVSHPIWASEDSGFVASKKNSNEEALHRCEEERYEYDLNIEANLNTITLLEPIEKRIQAMTPEEREAMRLEPGLEGPTVSIYERIIKKVYDNERGSEIIEMLYQRPATVLPVLLKRLKTKDKEWKKARCEWNKIWRELDFKNFYRSLDYQGGTFKSNDKKALANKTLITEIEILLQKEGSSPQFVYDLKDKDVYRDITRLIFAYVDHQLGYTKSDKQKIRGFLRTFVPMMFHVNHEEQDEEEEVHSSTEDSDADSRGDSPNGISNKDKKLIRGVLVKNGNSHSPAVKIEQDMDQDVDMTEAVLQRTPEEEELNLIAAAAAATAPNKTKKLLYSFFCNSHYYILFRLYQVLYERLSKMKSLDQRIKSNPELGKKFNKTALELDLYSNRFEDVDLSNGYYNAMLENIDHFFEGELDQSSFEENVRYIFGIDAYIMFTVDKVIQSLIKQIQLVATDKKSIELFKLFNEGQRQSSETRATSAYRSLAEAVLEGSDENLYKINFDIGTHQTSIQLLDKQKENEELSEQELYEEYMSNYIDWMHDTKGIDKSLLKPSFLSRNLRPQRLEKTFVKPQLRYKIQQESYHMYYIVGSEDVLYSVPPPTNHSSSSSSSSSWHQLLAKNSDLTMDAKQIYGIN